VIPGRLLERKLSKGEWWSANQARETQCQKTNPPVYCYCGAGFYKGIWEEILQQPVEVQVLESVLKGDKVCKIAVHLPSDR